MTTTVGTVPCNFRLVVQEAQQVPPGCRSLAVAWRKGVKEVSTGMGEVVNGDVVWGSSILISSLLFQGAEDDGKIKYEAKFCWLEVIRDGGSVLGHAQLDLAEFCDGRTHERMLQVWKTSGPALGNFRIKVSIEVLGSGLEGLAPLPRPPEVPRTAGEVGKGGISPGQFPASPQEGHLKPRHSVGSEDANFADWVRNAANNAQSVPAPWLSPMQMNLMPRKGKLPLPGGGSPREAFGPTSMHAQILAELPARLIALCNRQCLQSGLSSVQQEDAVQLFVSAFRRSHDPLPPCGIIFSTIPPQASAPSLKPRANSTAGAPSGLTSVPGNVARGPASNPTSPRHAQPEGANVPLSRISNKLPEPGCVPRLTVVATEDTPKNADSAASSPCTRHLYELLSHLSDIRSLAITLMPMMNPDRLPEGHGIPDSPMPPADDNLSPPSHLSAALSNAAAAFAAAAGRSPDDKPRGINDISAQPAVAWERGRSEAPFALVDNQDDSRGGLRSGSPPSPHQQRNGLMSPMATHGMVTQILQGIDQATGIGEQVLKEVGEELSALALQFHDASRDRELWAHRFLAARELKYSAMLCEQARKIDQMDAAKIDQLDFAVPVAA